MAASSHNSKHVMIISGEASGDMHGAALLQAMQAIDPALTFSGMGGSELQKAGMDVLFDAAKVSVVGLTEIITHLPDILSARSTLIREMKNKRPSLLILIDFPEFNLWLASTAKKLGIPVFYYISPQIWAWRKGRARKIGRLSSRTGVILPFEKEFYARYNIEVDFVGHPLIDRVKSRMSKEDFCRQYSIVPDNNLIAIIPGSREKEIKNLLPDFLAAAEIISKEYPNTTFLLPKAETIRQQTLKENGLDNYKEKLDVRVIEENRYDLMKWCQAAMAASGTVTLELALLQVPTVTSYRTSPLTYRIGKLLVRGIKYFSLVNLIADKRVIAELLQDEVTPERLSAETMQVMLGGKNRETTLKELAKIRNLLGEKGAAHKAAQVALSLIS